MDLLVYRDIERPADRADTEIMSFAELTRRAGGRSVLKYLFKYRRAELRAYALDSLSRPLAIALALRMMSRHAVTVSDERGVSHAVGWTGVLRLALRHLTDRSRVGPMQNVAAMRARDVGRPRECPGVRDDARPLYIRTDLAFNVRSGGSVGHTAGVLNNLAPVTGRAPVFVTSDRMPTVDPGIETHVVRPPDRFGDIPEIWALAYNGQVADAARHAFESGPPGFIYQRYSLNNFAGLLLSREFDVPLVLEFNSSELWRAEHWHRPLKYPKLAEVTETANVRGADLVVVVSEPLRDTVAELGADPAKVLVNPNGVNPEMYSPDVDGSAVRARFELDDVTVIGFIGVFGQWHGIEVLAEAFGRLLEREPQRRANTRLLLVGDGERMPQVLAALARHRVEDVTVMPGRVPQAEGPEYLAAMDVLVSPHVRNPDGTPFFGSPTKIFEYMAMGKGIVASRLDQLAQVLEHEHTGLLVPPGDVNALADAIARLADDPALRARLGVAARGEVVERHTWRTHTERIVQALHDRCGSE